MLQMTGQKHSAPCDEGRLPSIHDMAGEGLSQVQGSKSCSSTGWLLCRLGVAWSLLERNPEVCRLEDAFTARQRQAGQPRDRRPAQDHQGPGAALLQHVLLDVDNIQLCGVESSRHRTAMSQEPPNAGATPVLSLLGTVIL